jgi:hypothetical protein
MLATEMRLSKKKKTVTEKPTILHLPLEAQNAQFTDICGDDGKHKNGYFVTVSWFILTIYVQLHETFSDKCAKS